jgi:riboflavin synthase
MRPPGDVHRALDARGCEQAIELGWEGGDDHDTSH